MGNGRQLSKPEGKSKARAGSFTNTLQDAAPLSADADERKVAEYVGRFGGESYRAALEMIYNLPRPRKIKTPLLVVGARDDAIIAPNKIEKTARAFKADCEIFPDTAHDTMLERGWQKVADFMTGWLEKRIQ